MPSVVNSRLVTRAVFYSVAIRMPGATAAAKTMIALHALPRGSLFGRPKAFGNGLGSTCCHGNILKTFRFLRRKMSFWCHGPARTTDGKTAKAEDIRRLVPAKNGNEASGIKGRQPGGHGPVPSPIDRAEAMMAAATTCGEHMPLIDRESHHTRRRRRRVRICMAHYLLRDKEHPPSRGGDVIRRDYRNACAILNAKQSGAL